MNHWDVEEQPSGLWDVRRNRRAFKYDRDDEEECRRAILRSRFYREGDTVTVIDSDGRRSPMRLH